MAKSTYLDNAFLNYQFRGAAYTPPATYYVALCTSSPSAGQNGTTIPEVSASGTAYARQALAAGTGNFSLSSAGSTTNVPAINWTAATGAGFGTVTHVAVLDALSGGNLLYYGPLAASQAVPAGVAFSIGAGQMAITES